MTMLTSLFQRQLVCSPSKRAIVVDFSLEALQCVKEDEHFVHGRETGIGVPPFACRFNKSALGGYMLGVADEDGWVQVLDARKAGPKSLIKEWHAHENAVFDIAWMEDQQLLVTASGDQTIKMWDVSHNGCLAVFKGHSCSVKSVDFREDDIFVFATGSRDGNIMVWDVRCNRRTGHCCQPINKIFNAHEDKASGSLSLQRTRKKPRRSSIVKSTMSSGQQSVTAVVFQGSDKLISAGAVDGKIKIWDLRKSYTNLKKDPIPLHSFPHPGSGSRKHGFSSLVLDSTHSRLFASCTNDNIYMYSCTTLQQEPVCTFSGHLNSTFYVKAALSPDDLFLISGSSDNGAFIWSVTNPTAPPVCLTGHVGEVTSVVWCPSDQGMVVTCSDDNSFRIWRMDRRAQTPDNLNPSVVGKSSKNMPSNLHSAVNDKTSLLRTPVTSPSCSPGRLKKTVWTPPTKLFTNPRLNKLTGPIGTLTDTSWNAVNNGTTPTKNNLSLPRLSANGLQTDLSTHAATPSSGSPSIPHPPGSPLSPGPPPKESRVQSPQQFLSTWLQTNSRKRTHSKTYTSKDLDETKNSKLCPPLCMRENDLDLPKGASKSGKQLLNVRERIEVQEISIEKDRNGSTESNSPTGSPLRKRVCTLKELDSNEENKLRVVSEKCVCNLGKENVSPKQSVKMNNCGYSNCKQTLETAFGTKSNCQASGQLTKEKNWLIQWSEQYKATHGEANLPEREANHSDVDNLDKVGDTEQSDSAVELQDSKLKGEASVRSGESILSYFKPVSPL